MKSTEDIDSRYQPGKHEFNDTELNLWEKLSPLPLVSTISIAILAILISCTYLAYAFEFSVCSSCTDTISHAS